MNEVLSPELVGNREASATYRLRTCQHSPRSSTADVFGDAPILAVPI